MNCDPIQRTSKEQVYLEWRQRDDPHQDHPWQLVLVMPSMEWPLLNAAERTEIRGAAHEPTPPSNTLSRLDRIGALLDKLPKGEGLRHYHAGHELADAREALQALRAENEPEVIPDATRKLGELAAAHVVMRRALSEIVTDGDFTAPEGMTRIARAALDATASAAALAGSAPPPSAVIPDRVFDGYSVWTELQNDPQARQRTSHENVQDVLNAILRFKRATATKRTGRCPHGYELANLDDGTDTCVGCSPEGEEVKP